MTQGKTHYFSEPQLAKEIDCLHFVDQRRQAACLRSHSFSVPEAELETTSPQGLKDFFLSVVRNAAQTTKDPRAIRISPWVSLRSFHVSFNIHATAVLSWI